MSNVFLTKEDELSRVIMGIKPSAVGYWEDLPNNIFVEYLKPVYGRFYDMAIAKRKDSLDRVVRAYYAPITKESDIEFGLALGYTIDETKDYIKNIKYGFKKFSSKERTEYKILATEQKRGRKVVLSEMKAFLSGDKDAIKNIKRECLDVDYAINFLRFRVIIFNMKRVKQVIIARKDLKMNRGKLAAQVAHASMAVILDMMEKSIIDDFANNYHFTKREIQYENNSFLAKWLDKQFAKVVLKVNSEEELEYFYNKAKELNLPTSLIEDSGYTQFKGQKTKTTCAIGPCDPEVLDKLTGELKLYN